MKATQFSQRMMAMARRLKELERLMAEQEPGTDMRALSSEYGILRPPVELWRRYRQAVRSREGAAQWLREMERKRNSTDGEDVLQMIREEHNELRLLARDVLQKLQILLGSEDQWAECDVVLEVRAGAGGEEASLFAGSLLRMYARYAVLKGWSWQPVKLSETESGGCREAIVLVGGSCYHLLRHEAGVHRVQRVPATESQGRVHTSTCTVAVLPQMSQPGQLQIAPEDVRIDTFRASGAGGQHVNKTDSAVRATHLPTGMMVECQEDRSQHRNRTLALTILHARLLDQQRQEQQSEHRQQRRDMVGGGNRAEKIRTYNFPQLRVTDHRLGKSFHRLSEILDGDLDGMLQELAALREQE